MKVKSEREVAQSCLTLRDPMDCSLPGSSLHGILQARVLEWGAIAFSLIIAEDFVILFKKKSIAYSFVKQLILIFTCPRVRNRAIEGYIMKQLCLTSECVAQIDPGNSN